MRTDQNKHTKSILQIIFVNIQSLIYKPFTKHKASHNLRWKLILAFIINGFVTQSQNNRILMHVQG